MAVSTNAVESASSPLVAPAVAATPVAAKMTAKTVKPEPKTFDELFSAIAAEVPTASGNMAMDAQTLLDEWLANDLQQTGLLADVADMPSLFSSPSVNGSPDPVFLGESPLSGDLEMAVPLFGSPMLGDLSDMSPMFSPTSSSSTSPMVTPANAFESSPVLDVGMNFFPDLDSRSSAPSPAQKSKLETPTAVLVAQLAAAGAFNIPWGTEPATRQVPLHPTNPLQQAAALAAAQAAAEYRLTGSQPTDVDATMLHTPSKRKTVDLDEVDLNDEAAVKRAKNTDAARRSRMKKVIKMEGLERRVNDLESENSKLVLKVAVLESEKAGGEARELEYERRIKRLEEQVREAHKALLESRTSKE